MFEERTSVGLDVHARSVVAAAIDSVTGEVSRARLSPEHGQIEAWIKRLPSPWRATYEAGPTGFGLARHLNSAGVETLVAAPSKLQRPAGDRVKTDAKDALHLARLLKLGEIVQVQVPTVTQEAARDLVRAREDARHDLMAARHRLSKLLLRQGIVYTGGKSWNTTHELWLRRQRFDLPGRQHAFDAAYDALTAVIDRRDRLDTTIGEMAADSEFTPVVDRLGCLRGISTLTGFGLAVEIGDSSGASRSLGGITNTGNTHARRLMIEAAWHHRKPYRPSSPTMRRRWEKAPWRRRQPTPAPQVVGVQHPEQAHRRRERRDRPRTRRLVLVAGHHRMSPPAT